MTRPIPLSARGGGTSAYAAKAECPRPTSGFTLVEVLVVSAIVAILAAGAIPLYLGFIQSQREDAAQNIATSAAASANIFARRTGVAPVCNNGTDPTCVDLLNLYLPDRTLYEVDIAGSTVTVTDLEHPEIVQTATF